MDHNFNNNISPQSVVKTTTIIHLGLTAGQLLFGVVVFYITPQKGFSFDGIKDPMILIAFALAFGGFIGSTLMYRSRLASVTPEDTLAKKIGIYQTGFITRAALLEGPSLFCIVGYMLSGNLLLLAISGVIILYFISIRPTREKIIADLKLDYNEVAALDGQPIN
jgi:hypothetical protein